MHVVFGGVKEPQAGGVRVVLVCTGVLCVDSGRMRIVSECVWSALGFCVLEAAACTMCASESGLQWGFVC